MLPLALFKTHFSIGRSILTPKQVFGLAKQRGMEQVVFVEDSFYGFRETKALSEKEKIKFVFGIRLSVVQDNAEEKDSKLVFFAKNNDGVRSIKDLYTKVHCSEKNLLIIADLTKQDLQGVVVAVPFYDSYIFNNLFYFGLSDIQFQGKTNDLVFLEEDNGHPFDRLISQQLRRLKAAPLLLSKSIFYENRDDAEALQFYKAVCNRSQGKSPSFGNPNLNHFCSKEFCWESYLESNA